MKFFKGKELHLHVRDLGQSVLSQAICNLKVWLQENQTHFQLWNTTSPGRQRRGRTWQTAGTLSSPFCRGAGALWALDSCQNRKLPGLASFPALIMPKQKKTSQRLQRDYLFSKETRSVDIGPRQFWSQVHVAAWVKSQQWTSLLPLPAPSSASCSPATRKRNLVRLFSCFWTDSDSLCIWNTSLKPRSILVVWPMQSQMHCSPSLPQAVSGSSCTL